MTAAYRGGQTTVEIAASMGMSSGWVAARLKAAGLTLRKGGARRVTIDAVAVREAYVDQNRPMSAIAEQFGVNLGVVRRTLVDQGVPIRRHHQSVPCEELKALYVEKKMGTLAIAEHFGVSRSQVFTSLDRCAIPRRKPRAPEVSDQELQVHLDAGLSDIEIADLYAVKAWNVRERCRQAGLRRPPGGRFVSQVPPKPAALDLQQVYVEQCQSLSAIATEHNVTANTVKHWLEADGIQPREAGRDTRPANPGELSPTQLRDLYLVKGWTSEEIAAHLGRSKKLVILALHHAGVPLRRPGAGGPRQTPVALLTALYDDVEVCDTLTGHNVPIVRTFGTPSQRFPVKPELTRSLVAALYQQHGLSLLHIHLLTGHTSSAVRGIAQTTGLVLRAGGRSPWVLDNMTGP